MSTADMAAVLQTIVDAANQFEDRRLEGALITRIEVDIRPTEAVSHDHIASIRVMDLESSVKIHFLAMDPAFSCKALVARCSEFERWGVASVQIQRSVTTVGGHVAERTTTALIELRHGS